MVVLVLPTTTVYTIKRYAFQKNKTKKNVLLCRFTWKEETTSKLPACLFVSATTSASSPHVSHAWKTTSSILNTPKLTRMVTGFFRVCVCVCRCGSHSHLCGYWMSARRPEEVRLWLRCHADATRVPQRHYAILQEEDWKYSSVYAVSPPVCSGIPFC